MTRQAPAWTALLSYLLGDDEPLVGDLVEECPHRSRSWFWRQVMFAVAARAIAGASAAVREPQRLGGVLTAGAIFIVLCFQVAVSGSLLTDLIQRLDRAGATRLDHPEWLVVVVLSSLPAGWLLGSALTRLHGRSRIATILACGASAAVVASATLSVLSSPSSGSVFPSVARQTAAAMMFVLAMLVGGSRPARRLFRT